MNNQIEILSKVKVCEGNLIRCKHASTSTNTDMIFAVFLPKITEKKSVDSVYWLSGLTCTDENFSQKAGAFKKAAQLNLAIICPDTSPRGTDLPGEHDSYDFGSGAGFYLDATQAPWDKHYNMYSYVVHELPVLVEEHFSLSSNKSIMGHSMGGHGALTIGLKNPKAYASISAFAPIVNPIRSPWGEKAFSAYLGQDRKSWQEYDSCELIKKHGAIDQLLLIDQGREDEFLEKQLLTENLQEICEQHNQAFEIHYRDGYDHSYYFIASFIEDHLSFHHKALTAL